LQGETEPWLRTSSPATESKSLLLPPDLRDWLDEDHLAWFVIEAIEELDLEPFYADYRGDGHGRAAHDPKMMLTLLAYAYCVA
jgi:transposase